MTNLAVFIRGLQKIEVEDFGLAKRFLMIGCENHRLLALRFCCSRRKGSGLINMAGALHN